MTAPVRDLLPRTLNAFFGRFANFTSVQEQAIPALLGGRDALLCAPTASGKTEAYAAPLVERMLGAPRCPYRILFISPTRALANDLKRRLEERMAQLGVAFGRHTGEHKERVEGHPPEVAVMTPESLDSLLARRAAALAGVISVVLDEVHVLDGTPRGDHARLLLHRLDQCAAARPQRVAASATVDRPAEVAGRYLREALVVEAADARRIRALRFSGRRPAELAAHVERLAEGGFKKILLFRNSRRGVEEAAAGLIGRTRFGAQVHAHHGSLSRAVRERTERRLREATAAVCCATLTLELGIDIGDMDYVLLCDLPPSVDSLRQRIGRGGRRSLGDQRAGYVVETAGEDVAFRVLFRLAREGKLCREPYAFRPSVLVQQALVLGGAESHVSASRLSEVVPAEIERLLPAGWAAEILEAMADKGLVEQAGAGRYVLSEAMDRAYRIGKLHGNLDPEGDVPVIDRATGDLVGHVARGEQRGDRIQLGGSGREVVAVTADGVMTDAVAQGGPAHFAPRGHPAVSFALAREIARELGAAPNEIVQRAAGEGFVLLHGLGSAGAPLLRYLLRGMPDPPRILAHSPVSMILDRALEWLPGVDSSTVDAFVQRAGARMRGFLALGPWHGCLPREFKRSTMRRVSGVDQAAEFLSAAVLKIEMETPAPPAWIA